MASIFLYKQLLCQLISPLFPPFPPLCFQQVPVNFYHFRQKEIHAPAASLIRF